MKGSTKKVLVVLLVVGCLLVLGSFTEASAAPDFNKTLTGKYAGTGTSTCSNELGLTGIITTNSALDLVSTTGFGYVSLSSNSGIWTFNPNGTGFVISHSVFTEFSGYMGYGATIYEQDNSYRFTYKLTSDGTITINLVPGTWLTTFKDSAETYTIDQLSVSGTAPPVPPYLIGAATFTENPLYLTGKVSMDTMTITLTTPSSSLVEKRTFSNPSSVSYSSCHRTNVLISVGY
jgi:hypothetical protein